MWASPAAFLAHVHVGGAVLCAKELGQVEYRSEGVDEALSSQPTISHSCETTEPFMVEHGNNDSKNGHKYMDRWWLYSCVFICGDIESLIMSFC